MITRYTAESHLAYLERVERRVCERGYIPPTHEIHVYRERVVVRTRFTNPSSAMRYMERQLADEEVTSVTITKVE